MFCFYFKVLSKYNEWSVTFYGHLNNKIYDMEL